MPLSLSLSDVASLLTIATIIGGFGVKTVQFFQSRPKTVKPPQDYPPVAPPPQQSQQPYQQAQSPYPPPAQQPYYQQQAPNMPPPGYAAPSQAYFGGMPQRSSALQQALAQGQRFVHYPLILAGSILGLGIFLVGYVFTNAGHAQVGTAVTGVGTVVIAPVWIYTLVKTAQLKRWGWFVAALFFNVYLSFIFSIWGPTTPPPRGYPSRGYPY